MAKNLSIGDDILNHSSTLNSTNKIYNVSPIPFVIRVPLTLLMVLVGTGGIIANSLLLYFVRKQKKTGLNTRAMKAFSRTLTPYFIQSLAMSDFLCSLVNLPVFISQLYSDIVQNDLGCRAVRYMNLFFAVVTLNNLLVIGIERYIATFHPFLLPSPRFSKNLVILAWIAGGLIVIVPVVTFKTTVVDLGPNEYTVICIYEKTVPVYRAMFIGFTALCYIIPSVILTITNIRILVFFKRNKRISKSNQTTLNSWRFKGTKMFIHLIFAFIIPYFLYVFYSGLNIALTIKLSFTADYVVRRISGIIAYSNAVISPTVIFYSMQDLRRMLKILARKAFCPRRNSTVNAGQSRVAAVVGDATGQNKIMRLQPAASFPNFRNFPRLESQNNEDVLGSNSANGPYTF